MNNQEIFDLIACFDRSSVQTMKLSRQDFSIELSKNTLSLPGATRVDPTAVNAPVSSVSYPVMAAPLSDAAPAAGAVIKAPLVGTFYAAAAPDQAPFVAPGDKVTKGQTVCLIEAMKMMSEVPAPCDCVIEEILQESGALVSFDAPLVRYREV